MTGKISDIKITVRDREFVCPMLSGEHALFWGTLLMDEDELRVFVHDENPEQAMQMMHARLVASSSEMEAILSGGTLSVAEIQKRIDSEQVQKIVQRLVVRINQDQMPQDLIRGIRRKVATRLRECFPEFPTEWVSDTSINLEIDELVTAIAIPLFATIGAAAEAQAGGEAKPKPAKVSRGFKDAIAQATKPVPTVEIAGQMEPITQEAQDETAAEAESVEQQIRAMETQIAALRSSRKSAEL